MKRLCALLLLFASLFCMVSCKAASGLLRTPVNMIKSATTMATRLVTENDTPVYQPPSAAEVDRQDLGEPLPLQNPATLEPTQQIAQTPPAALLDGASL